jgi:large subunit ribosomal protein L18
MTNIKQTPKERRLKRVRAKIRGTKKRPRLTVFRSNKYTFAQIIDDEKGITLVAANEKQALKNTSKNQTKTERATAVGEILAKKALKKGIKKVAFDRGHYRYHGRIKALAEAARANGLIF